MCSVRGVIFTMNSELGRGVIISSATDVGSCIFRGAFADYQRALSPQGMDAKVLPWFQLHITLKMCVCFFLRLHTSHYSLQSNSNPNIYFLTLNHLTSAFVLDTSHSKVTFSFSGTLTSIMGLEIIAGGSVKSTIK